MDDQDYFQNLNQQTETEILNVVYQQKTLYQPPKKQKSLSWKFQQIPKLQYSPNQVKTKNISFQTEDYSIQQIQYDSNQQYISPLASVYQNCDQLYHKKKFQGIQWIGNKQFFASIFIDPLKIEKVPGQPFCLFSQSNQYIPSSKNNRQLIFDSQFQSGNLFCAYKVGKYQYDLLMQNDINTKGNTQWFYFRIRNVPVKQQIKINIVNMMKGDSLFNYGMLPCIYSKQAQAKIGQGWVRKGSKVKYFRNDNKIQNSNRFYSTLTFTISTSYTNDQLRVAMCYPYTTNDLNNFLQNSIKNSQKKGVAQRQILFQTIGGNNIELITIKQPNPRRKTRQIIIIMARQHPGETPGSFVCQGIINFLLSKNRQAQYLRRNYQFKIIPMINPDGVYAGNYRTNLMGFDLNRRWGSSNPSSKQSPNYFKLRNKLQSYLIKQYITDLGKKNSIIQIIDLHGHSRKMFSFFYGNPCNYDPSIGRIFPYLCSKIAPNLIRFEDSTFSYQQCKRKTARIQLNLNLKVPNIFTFQTSFFGYCAKDLQKKHFTQDGYRGLGEYLGKAIFIQQFQKSYQQSKEAIFYKSLLNDLQNNQQLIKLGDRNQSGSQTDPSQCQIKDQDQNKLDENIQYNKSTTFPKNKKIHKRILKKQIFKEVAKSTRQMMVMDVPKINSLSPHDILALVPNSYLIKSNILNQKRDSQVQCDEVPILKIYQTSKIDQFKRTNPRLVTSKAREYSLLPKKQIVSQSKIQKIAEKNLNVFKTVIRPRSSTQNCFQIQCQGNSNPKTLNYKQIRQFKQKRQQSGTQLRKKKIMHISKMVQTYLTLRPNVQLMDDRFESNEGDLVTQQKMSFSTIDPIGLTNKDQPRKRIGSGFKVGLKAINIQTWKIKKKSLYEISQNNKINY